MAHFAEIDENNIVVRVLVTDTNDPNGDEGHQWLVDNLGGTWIKTSYNTLEGIHQNGGTPLRYRFAEIGGTYDPVNDVFLHSRPFESWSLDTQTFEWVAPVPYPEYDKNNPKHYIWNEEMLNWKQVLPFQE